MMLLDYVTGKVDAIGGLASVIVRIKIVIMDHFLLSVRWGWDVFVKWWLQTCFIYFRGFFQDTDMFSSFFLQNNLEDTNLLIKITKQNITINSFWIHLVVLTLQSQFAIILNDLKV